MVEEQPVDDDVEALRDIGENSLMVNRGGQPRQHSGARPHGHARNSDEFAVPQLCLLNRDLERKFRGR